MWDESDRKIFSVIIAGEPRHFDPERLRDRLQVATRGKLNALITNVRRLQPEQDEDGTQVAPAALPESPEYIEGLACKEVLADAVCRAFGLEPFDPVTGEGTLMAEALRILVAFLQWEHELKKSGAALHS